MNKHITKADYLVLGLSVIFVGALYAFFWTGNHAAKRAEVMVRGEKQYILDLTEEKQIRVDGILGTSILEIHNGQVRFVESPCSGKVCIRSGWLAHVNDIAACLPNGVSLHLVGPNARFDSINF